MSEEAADEYLRRYHVDGELVPASQATVSVEDRGFAYGDAAFETLRAYGGEVFRWDDHAARLADTCETLGLDHGLSGDRPEVPDRRDARGQRPHGRLRETLYHARGPARHARPQPEVDPTVVVIAKPLARGGVDSTPVHDGPAAIQTTKTRKPSSRALPADAKTHNYLNGILARLELRVTGAGRGADARSGRGTSPRGDRERLLRRRYRPQDALARRADPPGRDPAHRDRDRRGGGDSGRGGHLRAGRGARGRRGFLTNSTWEIRPVETVDGIAVDGDGEGVEGPLTALLSRLFDRRVEERYYDGERFSKNSMCSPPARRGRTQIITHQHSSERSCTATTRTSTASVQSRENSQNTVVWLSCGFDRPPSRRGRSLPLTDLEHVVDEVFDRLVEQAACRGLLD